MLEDKVNLDKPLGFFKILFYSAVFGASIGFALRAGSGITDSQTIYPALDTLSAIAPGLQGLIMIVSLILAIASIFRLAKFFKKIIQRQYAGIITAILGIFGSLLIVLSYDSNMQAVTLGVGFWIIGIVTVASLNKKY